MDYILGIDQSFGCTGLSLFNPLTKRFFVSSTKKYKTDSNGILNFKADFKEKLLTLSKNGKRKILFSVVEDFSRGSINRREESGMVMAIVLLVLAELNIPYIHISQSTWKSAIGINLKNSEFEKLKRGNNLKKKLYCTIIKRFLNEHGVRIKKKKDPRNVLKTDEADATCLAFSGFLFHTYLSFGEPENVKFHNLSDELFRKNKKLYDLILEMEDKK